MHNSRNHAGQSGSPSTRGNTQDPDGLKLLNPKPYLEGQGDLVTGLLMGIIGVTIWVIGVTNLLTKFPLTLQVNPKLGQPLFRNSHIVPSSAGPCLAMAPGPASVRRPTEGIPKTSWGSQTRI